MTRIRCWRHGLQARWPDHHGYHRGASSSHYAGYRGLSTMGYGSSSPCEPPATERSPDHPAALLPFRLQSRFTSADAPTTHASQPVIKQKAPDRAQAKPPRPGGYVIARPFTISPHSAHRPNEQWKQEPAWRKTIARTAEDTEAHGRGTAGPLNPLARRTASLASPCDHFARSDSGSAPTSGSACLGTCLDRAGYGRSTPTSNGAMLRWTRCPHSSMACAHEASSTNDLQPRCREGAIRASSAATSRTLAATSRGEDARQLRANYATRLSHRMQYAAAHGTDGRTRGEETERLRTMLDRTQTPRTTIITVDAGNRPIVDVPSQHHAIYSLYRQPPPDYHQGQDAGRPAQRSQSTMDAVWCDESIVDTARTATMEQAPGQDDDRRPATLTPPLLPEPDKVTLTPQH